MFAELMGVTGLKPDSLGTLSHLLRTLSKGRVDSLLVARSRDAMRALTREVLDLRLDRARLDFIIEHGATWSAGYAPGGTGGLLCYWAADQCFEVVAVTMREAVDVAMAEARDRKERGQKQAQ